MGHILTEGDKKRYLRYIAGLEKQIAHKREVASRHINDGYLTRAQREIAGLEARIVEFQQYIEQGYRDYEEQVSAEVDNVLVL